MFKYLQHLLRALTAGHNLVEYLHLVANLIQIATQLRKRILACHFSIRALQPPRWRDLRRAKAKIPAPLPADPE